MTHSAEQTEYHKLLKEALLSIDKLQEKVRRLKGKQTEPIAVVGMGCRFPGGGDDPHSYWRILRDGVDAITEVPPDRWDIEDYFDSDPDVEGKMYSRWGGFIRDIDQFDPLFFKISPKEAIWMDPQQRLLLEVTWEALENAGQDPAALMNSLTGVFVGISGGDYADLSSSRIDVRELYSGTGNAFSVASGRISYSLGLRGPCMSIDTACSSSLVATHLAIQSLRLGECDMALAAGVNLILVPEPTIIFCKGRMLSFDGHCKTFDAGADGYVRGEGCGVIVLKRLSDAQADGDRIHAVLCGSAVNQDGRSSGLTAPNGVAQEAVIRAALKNAGVDPSAVDYIEAHGTATPLGDPIEMHALNAVMGQAHTREKPLIVSSLKPNIGHLEPAAGIASLIKAILAIDRAQIPPHPLFKTPSPHIPWEEIPIVVPTELTAWPGDGESRVAGVSSFGFSGTNAHVILRQAPAQNKQDKSGAVERPYHLLALSAATQDALNATAKRYAARLASPEVDSIADICHTAGVGRKHLEQRLAIIGKDKQAFQEGIAAFTRGIEKKEVMWGSAAKADRHPKIAFLFTGQGSQYVGMGRELYATQPFFRRQLDACDEILQPLLKCSIVSILYPQDETDPMARQQLNRTAFAQPALFALEYALARLWRSWGIAPSVVMGHSVGEYVAACIAGVFSLSDGLKLIAQRARLMQALPAGGTMAAVLAAADQVAAAIAPYQDTVAIAALNGPRNTVISGQGADVQAILAKLSAQGIASQLLEVSHAFHSPLIRPMVAEFRKIADEITYSPPKIRLVSNLTGKSVEGEDIACADWWCRHILAPVEFARSIESLRELACGVFLEVGPSPILLGMAQQCEADGVEAFLPSLSRGQEDWAAMLQSLATLYIKGFRVDWQAFDQGYERLRVSLPTYPFQRRRYWIEDTPLEGSEVKAGRDVKPDTPEWLYRIEWSAESSDSVHTPGPTFPYKNALLFADPSGPAQALSEKLTSSGVDCRMVFKEDKFTQHADGHYAVDPGDKTQLKHLMEAYAAETGRQPFGIIHMWSLDAGAGDTATLSSLVQTHQLQCATVLQLIQVLEETRLIDAAHLWLVTRGGQIDPVMDDTRLLHHAPLWGLGRTVMVEYPRLVHALIDLDPRSSDGEVEALLGEIQAVDGESQVAFRNGARRVARLRPVPESSERLSVAAISDKGRYLITGGLGRLGLQAARWLAALGAPDIVLVGRKSPSETAIETIKEIEDLGARVDVRQADICNPDEVDALVTEFDQKSRPLRGVMHLAGLLDDGLLAGQSWERFSAVMAPKITGAWNLHNATCKRELDFFVLFSSVSSVLGSAGQAGDAAANAFMDALAQYRSARGLPGLSVNWGLWEGAGMAAAEDDRDQRRMAASGIAPISGEKGFAVLDRLLRRNAAANGEGLAQVGVLPIDWAEFFKTNPMALKMPLLVDVATKNAPAGDRQTVALTRAKFLEAAPEERQGMLTAYISGQVAAQLMIELPELDLAQPLPMLGFDSLMAVQVKNRIEADLEIALNMALFLEGLTVHQLADHLAEAIVAGGDASIEAEEIWDEGEI
jgi:acyl transferase domain-containing protein/acyl carrier protein